MVGSKIRNVFSARIVNLLLIGGEMEKNHVGRILCTLAITLLFSPLTVFGADDLMSAFKEGCTSGTFRIYHWEKDYDDAPSEEDSKSTLIGGYLSYETAPLSGFTTGVGFRTQHNLISHDEDYGDYFYFFPLGDNSGITAMSEAYLRYNDYDTVVTLGRQYIDTPYMNPADFRMMPKAFQGLSLINNSLRNFEFNAGYFTRWVDWNDPDYKDMISREYIEDEFGVDPGDIEEDKPVIYGGVSYQPIRGMDVNLWYYQFTDLATIISPNFKWFKVFNANWKGFIDLRYAQWGDNGDKLAGDVDTYMIGFIGGIIYKDVSLVLYGQKNGDQAPIEPYGHRRAVTQQVNFCELAEETAYMAKLEYNFAGIGVPGLSAYVRYGIYDTPEYPEENYQQDKTETEFSATYEFGQSLKGLSVRLRYAMVDMDDSEFYQSNFAPPFGPPAFLDLGNAYMPAARRNDATDLRFSLEYTF